MLQVAWAGHGVLHGAGQVKRGAVSLREWGGEACNFLHPPHDIKE